MGLFMELWKPLYVVNRNSASGKTVRLKVEIRMMVADEAVVVMIFL